MCGIAGILSNSPSEGSLRSMLAAMKHRGPDDRGVWIKEGMHLGHNRLSIIDLSPAGHQPMLSHSGRYVIVYNGEVYNFQELRKELLDQGVSFHSHTDTEVILALWEREGTACISRLRGMFAFAIWDQLEKTLTLVRDRLGIKPLYYSQTPKGFVFASEIKGMLASGLIDKNVNQVAISHLLNTGYIVQPDTIISNVWSLSAGHILIIKNNQLKEVEYWNIKNIKATCTSEVEAIGKIRQLLISAVSEEMLSERAIGVFLSGGLDSTLLVAALRLSGHKSIKTFSIGFDSFTKGLNESHDAESTAAFYKTTHLNIHTTYRGVSDDIEEFIEAIDQPTVDGLNTWLVSRYTSPHVTVALSGLGADELFSGYGIDRRLLYWSNKYGYLSRAINFTKPLLKNITSGKIKSRIEDWAERAFIPNAYSQWGRIFNPIEIHALTGICPQKHIKLIHDKFSDIAPGKEYDDLQRVSGLHLSTFMGSRLLRDSDSISMRQSMEVRFPFIDHRLVELVFPLPMKWKIKIIKEAVKMRNYESENSYDKSGVKHLLFQAFKNDLPYEFGNRPKRGFRLPIQEWLKDGLELEIKDYFFDKNSYLNTEGLTKVWYDWKSGNKGWGQIWILYVIEKWIKKYLV